MRIFTLLAGGWLVSLLGLDFVTVVLLSKRTKIRFVVEKIVNAYLGEKLNINAAR